MGENNRFSFAKTSFGTLLLDLNALSGFSVGDTSACLWGQLWGQLVNHSATRVQVSIGLAGNCSEAANYYYTLHHLCV